MQAEFTSASYSVSIPKLARTVPARTNVNVRTHALKYKDNWANESLEEAKIRKENDKIKYKDNRAKQSHEEAKIRKEKRASLKKKHTRGISLMETVPNRLMI